MTDKESPHLTVIVPSRDLRGLLQACLWAIKHALANQNYYPTSRVIVVDNASRWPLEAPNLEGADKILRFDAHHSFSSCVNEAARYTPQADILLLNNDCLVHPQSVQRMVECLRDDMVGIVGARLIYPDGSLQHGGVASYPSGPRHPLQASRAPAFTDVTFPVAVTGALMLIRSKTFRDLDGLDESYVFGSEDIDFCNRARIAGWRVACVQSVESLHFESTTPGRFEKDIPSRQTYREIWAHRITHQYLGG